MPRLYGEAARPRHPAVAALRSIMDYDDHFADAAAVRRAIAAYYGLVSFLDDNVGKVLAALEAAGVAATTRVIYTSDHGDNLGCRTLWGKSVMYEESAAVPLIVAGPGVPAGTTVATTGVAGRLLPLHPRGRGLRPDRRRRGPALPLAVGHRGRRAARSARCCRSTTRPARSPAAS